MKMKSLNPLTTLRRQKFIQQHPGPFACFHGSEGVDSTIDIVCAKTDKVIISSYYWNERDQAILAATTVAAALNLANGHSLLAESQYTDQIRFRQPARFFEFFEKDFYARRELCPLYGPIWSVNSGDRIVITRVNLDSMQQTKLVALEVASALNKLREEL